MTKSQNLLLKCISSNGLECFAYVNKYLISVRLKYQLSLLLTAPYPTRIKQTPLYLRPDIISQSMASFQLLHSLPLFLTNLKIQKNHKKASFLASDSEPQNIHSLTHIARDSHTSNNGALDSPKPTRRVRTKKPTSSSSSSSTSTPKKTKRSTKTQVEKSKLEAKETTNEAKNADPDPNSGELFDYDDGIDFPYLDPPLVCCFGGARKEFVPTVRVSDNQMDPDVYSEWKNLQWDPPEFVRAPGGPPSNVAISHVRLGGRAAFMGKVAKDEFGGELVRMMNVERVQTRAVKFDKSGGVKTACAYVKIVFDEDGKMRSEVVKEAAEDSLLVDELNLAVLKEARLFHFNSEVLISPLMKSTLFRAIAWSKKFGGLIFFDLNLPLPLWRSRDETREIIKKAWSEANIIEVSRQELEFLLDEDYYERKKNYRHEYYAEDFEQTKNRRNYYHYTREEISPLWHDGLKLLFVTDGTLRIHYYTPSFDGVVIGTEDVLITPFTCDRTGSGDAVVAGIMRKLTTYPEMFENQDILERQLRFAIAAGIISQWTIGAVRGFPTESAAQNLKEQVYIPSMW